MKIYFSIDYLARWGERLRLKFDGCRATVIPMTCSDDGRVWTAVAELDTPAEYRYELTDEQGNVLRSEVRTHRVDVVSVNGVLWRADVWQDPYSDRPFHSTAFTESIFRRPSHHAPVASVTDGMMTIRAIAPTVRPDQTLAVCGSTVPLGAWDVSKAVVMSDARFPLWEVTLPFQSVSAIEFKFVVLDASNGNPIAWEPSDNRRLVLPQHVSAAEFGPYEVGCAGLPWRGAGTAIPVFSLRSDSDYGIGDFEDLKLMADWAAKTGQQVVQLLPVNDTTMTHTWTDSYPYNSNSVFALHPLYLRPEAIGVLSDKTKAEAYELQRRELQALDAVDYERAQQLKDAYVRDLYLEHAAETIGSDDFIEFVSRNDSWLTPYAAFCVLRDRYGTPDMNKWGEYAVYNPQRIAAFVDANIIEIQFVYFQQYHLDRQLRGARDYALSKGVILKGDIPIGVSRTSADAWTNPTLYNLDSSAGAPPDDFSVLGQNWGFPTYNWDEMARDGYAWWKARFRKMAEYFDAYRIDHVLGFFRIWQIPLDALHGLLGVFNSALPFSRSELRDSYGFELEHWMTEPLITDWTLAELFGDAAADVRARFVNVEESGHMRLKPEYSTQRSVADNVREPELIDGLLNLIDQVLFIEDPYKPDHWHPRISGRSTMPYRVLDDARKHSFDRLYDDFYYRRNDGWWREKAMQKLPDLIDATGMLVCAEDLGMIPACVPEVMQRLQILSLEIQRMPKDPALRFGQPWNYPYMSVCTTSTHDMSGIRAWWEADRDNTQAFYNQMLGGDGDAPVFAEPWICRRILEQNLAAPSMLCILPLQDWLSVDGKMRRQNPKEEQINEPSNPHHYWRYRMHLTLEQLLAADDFNATVRRMITVSGR